MFLASTLIAVPLGAEAPTADKLVAQSLFEKGRALMAQGNYPEACRTLSESQRRDPGGGTLLNLALCHELEGKATSAWLEFQDALWQAERDKRKDRADFAEQHLAVLKTKIARVVVKLNHAAAATGVELKVDGQLLPNARPGGANALDPGSHDISASATGKKTWSQRISMGPGSETTIEVPELADLATPTADRPSAGSGSADPAVAAPNVPIPGIVATSVPSEALPRSEEKSRGDTRRTVGFAVGGAGAVALGVGAYFGVRAFSKWSERNEHCPSEGCDAQAVTSAEDANDAARAANIGVGIGLVALGVGTYLVVSSKDPGAPPKSARGARIVPEVGPRGGGFVVGGSW